MLLHVVESLATLIVIVILTGIVILIVLIILTSNHFRNIKSVGEQRV